MQVLTIKIGDIQIAPEPGGVGDRYIFTQVVHNVYSALGTYSSIEEGIARLMGQSDLRPKDRKDLETLLALLKEKNGDMKEVRKATIDLE